MAGRGRKETASASGLRRRAEDAGRHRVPRPRRARHRRHLPRLPVGATRLEGQGAGRRWTTPICAISSSICIACSIRKRPRAARPDAMEQKTSTTAAPRKARTRRRPTAIKSVWVAVRRPLAQSRWLQGCAGQPVRRRHALRRLTNPLVAGSADPQSYVSLPPGDRRAMARPAPAWPRLSTRAGAGSARWFRAAPMPRSMRW